MATPDRATAATAATAALRARLGRRAPSVGLILGSGLGGLVDEIDRAVRVSFDEVPGFAAAAVPGHAGQVVAGTLEGCEVVALAGRAHLYEGHPSADTALPVRVLHALGVRTLFVSNAAGGLRRTFRPGDLMLIHDHVNLTWRNPLIGPVRAGETRFPDMSDPYDRALLGLLRAAALEARVPVVEGVYVGLSGPTYETPAEVRMLQWLGGDAVGMSTVTEVIQARAFGMRVAGVSCITNVAAGQSPAPLSHDEVLQTAARAARSFQALVRRFVRTLASG
jgi:purine-nucleoside phosphorylase